MLCCTIKSVKKLVAMIKPDPTKLIILDLCSLVAAVHKVKGQYDQAYSSILRLCSVIKFFQVAYKLRDLMKTVDKFFDINFTNQFHMYLCLCQISQLHSTLTGQILSVSEK